MGISIKYFFGLIVLVLLGFIAFSIFQDKYLNGNKELVVAEERVIEAPILEKVEAIGRIELVKHTYSDVVKYAPMYRDPNTGKTVEGNNLLGKTRILIVISAEAVGCIDFSKITENDIVESEDSLTLFMPEPEVCYFKINHKDTEIIDASQGLAGYTDGNKTEIIDKALKKAEASIETMAIEGKILEQTADAANVMLKSFLQNLSNKKIAIIFREKQPEKTELEIIE